MKLKPISKWIAVTTTATATATITRTVQGFTVLPFEEVCEL